MRHNAYYLKTFHGTIAGMENGVLVHAQSPLEPAILIPLDMEKGLLVGQGLLVKLNKPDDLSPFELVKNGNEGLTHLMTMDREGSGLGLRGYKTGDYLSALPSRSGQGEFAWKGWKKQWETFQAIPLEEGKDLDLARLSALHDFKAYINKVFSTALNDAPFGEKRADSIFSLLALDMILNYLPKVYLGRYQYDLSWQPLLKMAYKGREIYDCLDSHAYFKSRNINIGENLDILTNIWHWCDTNYRKLDNSSNSSVPAAVNYLYKQKRRPTKRCCILASAKNEGVYIPEFIAFYRALGVDDFFIYSNDNTDGSDELLKLLADKGYIYHIHNEIREGSPQIKAFTHALLQLDNILDFEWVINVDIDELVYLNPQKFSGLIDLLDYHSALNSSQISLNWVHMYADGRFFHDSALLMEKYDYGRPMNIIKSIIRPHESVSASPHRAFIHEFSDAVWRTASGKPYHFTGLAFAAPEIDNSALVLHYVYRSFEEFVYKFSRRAGDRGVSKSGFDFSRMTPKNFQIFANNFKKGSGASFRFSSGLMQKTRNELAQILADPEIGKTYALVEANFKSLVAASMEAFNSVIKESGELNELAGPFMEEYLRIKGA